MRALGRTLSLAILVVTAAPAPSEARLRTGPAARGEERAVEVRRHARGGDALWVDGRLRWPAAGETPAKITTRPVWSRRGDAIAFVVREPRGMTRLVVVYVEGELAPHTLSWPIPPSALPARSVTWLGPTRVAVGAVELEPKVIATWQASR
jgi:hypothetical protein